MKYLLILLLLVASSVARSQSLFKAYPKPILHKLTLSLSDSSATPTASLFALRAIVFPAAYSVPGNILMAGSGLGIQKLTFHDDTQKWYCNYSISAVGFAGGSVVPATPAQIMSYGVMIGGFNNLIAGGAVLNGNKVQAVISLGISLNN